jgi:hypothetical protein
MYRRFWREALMLILLVAPVLALAVVGVLSLIHSQWFYWGFGLLVVAGLAVGGLGYWIRQSADESVDTFSPADSRWAPAEQAAWLAVQKLAVRAQTDPPQDLLASQTLAEEVVQTVAKQLHAKSEFAWLEFTLPEILLAIEQTAQRMSDSIGSRVPGSQRIKLADVMVLHRLYSRHEKSVRVAWWAYRAVRMATTPQIAVVQEVKGGVSGLGMTAGINVAQGLFARLLTEELGRTAIDLYAGRLQRTALQASQALQAEAPAPTGPVVVRLLIAGQINAGKSSLANALLGSVKAPVSELPTPGGLQEFRLQDGAALDLTVLDSPGISTLNGRYDMLVKACERVDLIVWVVKANQPARAVDLAALQGIRQWFLSRPEIRPPPMVISMTHIDQLSPAREWAPPYDIANPVRPKAALIRQAMTHVAHVLETGDDALVPLSVREGESPYNLEALWAAIASQMNDAQTTALDRALKEAHGFSLKTTFQQCYEGGRFLTSKLWHDRLRSAFKI